MNDDREGVEDLRQTIDRVAASLPQRPPPLLFAESGSHVPEPLVVNPTLRAVLAAGIVLLVLGYPAFLGLYELPMMAKEVEKLRLNETSVSAGPVGLDVLSFPGSTIRAPEPSESIVKIEMQEEQPFVLLIEVDPEWLDLEGVAEYLLEIRGTSSEVHLTWNLDSSQLKRFIDLIEAIPLLFSGTELRTGRYRLRFTCSSEGIERHLSALLFDIVPPT